MSTRTIEDNKYPVGTKVYAIAYPQVQLTIRRYYQRIYYCTPLNDQSQKDFAYFEREITPA